MIIQDQAPRTTDSLSYTMRNVDSISRAKYMELLKSTDLLDERIIRDCLGDLGTLFTHWLDNKDFREFITPLMLKAVQDGRYDARLFAEQMDYAVYRDNDFLGSFLQYGTHLLKIFVLEKKEEDRSKPLRVLIKEGKYFAYFDFDKKNPNDIKKIKEIDQNRAKIYLGSIIETKKRVFRLYIFRAEKDNIPYKLRVPAIFIEGREENLSLLEKEIEKNPNLIYYIPNKHDFNIK